MPSELTREQVAAIAALANLALEPAELDLFASQLAHVLDAVNTLAELDTTGVPPTAAIVTRHPVDRADDPRPSLDRETAVGSAPDPSPDLAYFRVPRVIG
ncbi:MAG TPA: Asp-tRNA(Asn)/Glu-tRNA(Gln) amidotransferase subunit GatC [Vicinamibacterales bacterium]|nr:Asp-tRNA(Asn)/Glu-tRNA(Gln) amidotransferase subunit GatC [Vicinamibacterales bacterium]